MHRGVAHSPMNTAVDTCRSPTLVLFDWCVFSLSFSRSLAFEYADVAACFVFFFCWFILMHNTSPDHMCVDSHDNTQTSSIWDEVLNDTLALLT